MITLKLSRDKIISLHKITGTMIGHVQRLREKLSYNLLRGELGAHLYILQDLNRKLSIKILQLQMKPGNRPTRFSVNEIEAFLLMHYFQAQPVTMQEGYELATLQEISDPIYKHLLN